MYPDAVFIRPSRNCGFQKTKGEMDMKEGDMLEVSGGIGGHRYEQDTLYTCVKLSLKR